MLAWLYVLFMPQGRTYNMTTEAEAGPEFTLGSAWLLSVFMFLLEPGDENLQTDSLAYKLIALFCLRIEFPSHPYYKVCRQFFWGM